MLDVGAGWGCWTRRPNEQRPEEDVAGVRTSGWGRLYVETSPRGSGKLPSYGDGSEPSDLESRSGEAARMSFHDNSE